MRRFLTVGAVVLALCGVLALPVSAQGSFAQQIQAALRSIGWVQSDPTFTQWYKSFTFPASGYLNFDTIEGSTGYGLRDNAGVIQTRNAGGSWADVPNASTLLGTTNQIVVTGLTLSLSPTVLVGTSVSAPALLSVTLATSSAATLGGGVNLTGVVVDSAYSGTPSGVITAYTIAGYSGVTTVTTSVWEPNPSANLEIGTIATPNGGHWVLYVVNVNTHTVTIDNNHGGTGNILTSSGSDVVLSQYQGGFLIYDGTSKFYFLRAQ